jgi:hypothetical protein
MPDNVVFQAVTTATPPNATVVSTEEVTTLNGATVAAQHIQRAAVAVRTADGVASDLLLGQQVRASSLAVALATQDAALLADLLTNTTFNAAGLATSAKQDTLNTATGTIGDAAVTAGAQGSVLALLRTLSRDLVANIVLKAGTAIIGKVGIDQTTPGTTNAVAASNLPTTVDTNSGNKSASTLRVVLATDQPTMSNAQPVSQSGTWNVATVTTVTGATIAAAENHIGEVGGNLTTVSTQFTRPNDGNAYAANDVVSDSTSVTTMQALAAAARVSGGSGYITGIRVNTDKKSITPRLRVHFYNTTGATLSADNAAWQDRYADNSKYVGSWDMPAMRTGADSASSTNSYAEDLTVRIPYTCAATTLYYVTETLDIFTPAANEVFTVTVFLDRN